MHGPASRNFRSWIFPLAILAFFLTTGVLFWRLKGNIFFRLNFSYLSFAASTGIGLHQNLPRNPKPLGRKVSQFLIGGYMLVLLGLIGRENMQIEGFFFCGADCATTATRHRELWSGSWLASLLYSAPGIGLAFLWLDNRAFCK